MLTHCFLPPSCPQQMQPHLAAEPLSYHWLLQAGHLARPSHPSQARTWVSRKLQYAGLTAAAW